MKRISQSTGIISLLIATIAILLIPSVAHAQATVSVSWLAERQQIDGFGVASVFGGDTVQSYEASHPGTICQAMFDPNAGIGLSILRQEIGSGGGSPPNTNISTIEPSKGTWDYTQDQGQVYMMLQAKKYGCTRFMGTVWSPPAWMKTNGSVINGNLAVANYGDFATYLNNYVTGYKSNHNLDIYGVSLANEPDYTQPYQEAQWTDAMFHSFISGSWPTSFPANLIFAEQTPWPAVNDTFSTLADGASAAKVNIVAVHGYGTANCGTGMSTAYLWDPTTTNPNPYALGKRIWETECSFYCGGNDMSITDGLTWANNIHGHMTFAEDNAWLYWIGGIYGSPGSATDEQGLVYVDPAGNTVTFSKRFYALGNWSKFVRPGWVRIDAPEAPASGVTADAYKSPGTGEFAIVLINNNASSQQITLKPVGFSATSVTPHTTSASQNLAQGAAINASGGVFTVTLPASSITTLTGTNSAGGNQLTDDLNDLTKLSSSTNVAIDTATPADFGGDTSRVKRQTGSDAFIVYSEPNMTSVTVKAYYSGSITTDDQPVLWGSDNGSTWYKLIIERDADAATAGGWSGVDYFAPTIPAAPNGNKMNYLKVELPATGSAGNLEIGQVKISYPSEFVDTLKDLTKVSSTSGTIYIDNTNPDTRVEFDLGRASRTTDVSSSLVYNVANLTSTNFRVYYNGAASNNAQVFTSPASGGPWTQQTPVQDMPVATDAINGWTRVNYSLASVPAGTNYLKITLPPNGLNWTPQISEVHIGTGTAAPVPPTPTGLTATAGNAQVKLNWNASSGATSYNIKRSTVNGSGYATIASPSTTSTTNTGLTNGTTYYYVVSAVNSAGESANSSQASATPTSGGTSGPVKINCAGPAASPFVADADFSGGLTATNWTGAIDTTAVTSPAPQAVYQSERYGASTYTIGGLAPSTNYTVRLHFCENYFTASAQRVFNVTINSTQVLTNFDIYAASGAIHKANCQQFTATANGSGQIIIAYVNVTNNALINGIEVNTLSAPAAPTGLTATAGNAQVALTWNVSGGATSYNVYRGTAAGGESGTAIATGISTTNYTNTGLSNGTVYYYTVKAVNAGGTSGASNEAHATPVTTVTDLLTDWTVVNSKSANWYLDNSNTANFNGDAGRAARSVDDTEYLVYKFTGITAFNAKVYSYLGPVTVAKFYSSVNNGTSYQAITVNDGAATVSAGGWSYYNIVPSGTLPAGTNALKVEFNAGTGNSWDPQLSQISITY